MAEFLMPILGADMTEGKLVSWRKHPGDRVERGEIIAEVETDKANVEVECYVPGVIERLLIEEDTTVSVGTPIALIKADDEAAAAAAQPAAAPAAAAPTAVEAPRPSERRAAPPAERVRASPAARQLAEESGIDLTQITGTGPGGRITREDVEAAASRPAAAPAAPAADERQARMRQAIAASMSRSAREIPHFHLTREIDMKAALAWLSATNEGRSVADRLLYAVLLIKAVALALKETPDLNAEWQDRVVRKPEINVGMAISLRGGGLVAPALLGADKRSLADLMAGFRDLVQRTRSGKLLGSEMTEGTITITNLGELGADSVYGIIYPHQVALVGFGRITEQVRVADGMMGPRPVIIATLSADHRVVDGHLGSTYLAAVDRLLQEPDKL
ncbi:MAG TPA: dihydrolipoamide acetyltransferase family protein [Dehalococcoidia bacterium]|jgi:pyruvate dehydrogenase E2 component (dihydrolipoamide acetyltransferase)|nr:dihydrolipoamide acetyltransferase family protein [Dehalococcoidia bacterium]